MSLYPGFNIEKENLVFNVVYGKVWLDGDFFVRNMDASVEFRHYKSHLQRKFFTFEWKSSLNVSGRRETRPGDAPRSEIMTPS